MYTRKHFPSAINYTSSSFNHMPYFSSRFETGLGEITNSFYQLLHLNQKRSEYNDEVNLR